MKALRMTLHLFVLILLFACAPVISSPEDTSNKELYEPALQASDGTSFRATQLDKCMANYEPPRDCVGDLAPPGTLREAPDRFVYPIFTRIDLPEYPGTFAVHTIEGPDWTARRDHLLCDNSRVTMLVKKSNRPRHKSPNWDMVVVTCFMKGITPRPEPSNGFGWNDIDFPTRPDLYVCIFPDRVTGSNAQCRTPVWAYTWDVSLGEVGSGIKLRHMYCDGERQRYQLECELDYVHKKLEELEKRLPSDN